MSRTQTVDDIVREWTFVPGDLVTTRAYDPNCNRIGIVIFVSADTYNRFSVKPDTFVVAWSLVGGGMKIQDKLFVEHISHVSR